LEDIDRGGHSSAQAAEEHAPGRRMLQQRQDQSAMLIEPRGLTDDRHDAIRAGELEERFDVHVRHAVGELAQPLLRANLAAEAAAPAAFVPCESWGVERLAPEGVLERAYPSVALSRL